jgi:hypothetical protein
MANQTVFVSVASLPTAIQSALASKGYGRKDIGISAKESFSFSGASGDGYRAFAVLLNMATGESKEFIGSWGGGNAFVTTHVDDDQTAHAIPVDGAVIDGQIGGNRPVSAHVTVHPANFPKYLPITVELSSDEKAILVMFRSYTSAYRKETLRPRHAPIIAGLVAKGLLKQSKNGATAITTDGKNAVAAERI